MVTLITFPFGILLLLLSPIQFGHGFLGNVPRLAEVTPDDPVIEVGDTLVLNCTLTPFYNETYNASDIRFDHSGKNYTYPYVQTLSNITAQLQLPNITISMYGSYQCRLPGTYLGLGAAQSLHVVRRPLKPVLDGCVISNWEKMECSWSPSRARQDNHTNGSKSFVQTLFYRHPGDDDNWKTCPQNTSEKCTWPASQFKMGANYCIQINATNILKYIVTSDVTCVVAQDEIVKPNPPENVMSSFASEFDGYVTLRWDPPASSYPYEIPLIYQVDVRNQWQDQVSNVTTETSMTLSVVPATNYIVQISVRPSRHGFASDKVVKRFVTPDTVPCKNPHTQTNAFFLVKESETVRTVRLYWQPITARDSCGPNLSYEVRARQSDGATNSADRWRTVSSVASSDNIAEVMLSKEEDEVTIQSKNNIGIATDLPHVIIRIPPSSSKGNSSSNYMYRLVVEGNDNSVMAHWFDTAQVENVMGYTLFWCQLWSFNHICKTPIQWKNLNGAEFEYNFTLSESYVYFQIGLAVNFLSGSSSGIMWADKLYSQTAKAETPQNVEVVTPYLGYHGEIEISWTTTPCIVRCAYVHTFIISYCLVDHQNRCHGETQNVSIASWKSFTYSLANLEHGSKYKIWMTSVARTGNSEPSDPIYATTTKSWVTAGTVAGIIIAILCVGTIAIGGLYIILRRCNKCRKKLVDRLNIPVAVPLTHRVQISSTSSEVPMLGKFEYNRQESVSSGDSGRYSLSPASPATSPLLPKLTDANENLDSFMPGNFNTLEDVKVEDDNDSTRDCVLSYTLVSNDAPEGESVVPNGFQKSVTTLPNGAAKMGDVRNPGVVSNGDITSHSKYIFPEQIELLGLFPSNPESDVNYCTTFSFARPSTGNTSGNSVADIGYTKVENLQPLYDLVDRLPNADAVNEQSQDYNVLQSESSQDEESVEQSDLVYTIDQLLATLNADPLSTNDLQIDNPATSSENSEPEVPLPPPPPPRPGENDAAFRGYMKIANTDFPNLACDDVEWGAGKPDFPQQSPTSNWGYVDHTMFGVDSVA